jgi:hypothetical protein
MKTIPGPSPMSVKAAVSLKGALRRVLTRSPAALRLARPPLTLPFTKPWMVLRQLCFRRYLAGVIFYGG